MTVFIFIFSLIPALSLAAEPEISVSGPWRVQEISGSEWTFHNAKHTAYVTLSTHPGRLGITMTYQNRTLHTPHNGQNIPLLAPPFSADTLSSVRVQTQGPDLLIQLEGPSQRSWTGLEKAPEDPLLSWVRVRVRDQSLRFSLRGLHRWTLPASDEGPHPVPGTLGGIAFDHGFGHWQYRTNARAVSGEKRKQTWYMDTSGSIDLAQPYPQTVVDWTPSTGNPRPEPNKPQSPQSPHHPAETNPSPASPDPGE